MRRDLKHLNKNVFSSRLNRWKLMSACPGILHWSDRSKAVLEKLCINGVWKFGGSQYLYWKLSDLVDLMPTPGGPYWSECWGDSAWCSHAVSDAVMHTVYDLCFIVHLTDSVSDAWNNNVNKTTLSNFHCTHCLPGGATSSCQRCMKLIYQIK